jgi:hypothetical protein
VDSDVDSDARSSSQYFREQRRIPARDGSRLISASDDTTVAQFRCLACADPDSVIRKVAEWV